MLKSVPKSDEELKKYWKIVMLELLLYRLLISLKMNNKKLVKFLEMLIVDEAHHINNGKIMAEVQKFEVLRKIKNSLLFVYTLILLKGLSDESSKKSLIQTVKTVISEYRSDIDWGSGKILGNYEK